MSIKFDRNISSLYLNFKMITFKIEKDGNEFHAWSPELPGCHTHGKSPKEAMVNLKDAANLYLETVMEESLTRQTLAFA